MHSDAATAPARLSDGTSGRSIEVVARLDTSGVMIGSRGAASGSTAWAYGDLASGVPLHPGSTDAVLSNRARPGASLYVADAAFLAALLARAPALSTKAFRRQGLKPGIAAGGIVFSITAAVFALDLSPSKGIARLMPDTARATLGDTVLRSLPVRNECAGPAGRTMLDALTDRLVIGEPMGNRVTVLNSDVLNAFAIPGGRVVLTRRIIAEARSADELAGVIAHELGHGLELHPEAGLVRSVGFWALVQMMFTGTPGAIGNAGTLLLQLAYTRTAEREADDHALVLLKRAAISPKGFADFFRRLDGGRANRPDRPSGGGRDIFSTHPTSDERIRKIDAQPAYPAQPALTDAQWQILKSICG